MLLGGPVISTSLAATLTITGTGNSNAVEFGQGSQVAVACDTSINTAISESWETSTSRFKVTGIVLTNINLTDSHTALTSNAGCGTKAIKVGLVGSNGFLTIGTTSTSPTTLVLPTTATSITDGSSGAGTTATSNLIGGTAAVTFSSIETSTVTFTLPASVSLDPASIIRISLESA